MMGFHLLRCGGYSIVLGLLLSSFLILSKPACHLAMGLGDGEISEVKDTGKMKMLGSCSCSEHSTAPRFW